MTDHISNRDKIIQSLREELLGPSPQGKTIKCSGEIKFESEKDFYSPWKQENDEEILQRDAPSVRYGVGVLYPRGTKLEAEDFNSNKLDKDAIQDNQEYENLITDDVKENIENIK